MSALSFRPEARRIQWFVVAAVAVQALTASKPAHGGATFIALDDLGGNDPWGFMSRAYGVSGDGLTVVGDAIAPDGRREAFRWTAATGMQSLRPPSEERSGESWARRTSWDGSVIVGHADGNGMYWTAQTGVTRIAPPSFERTVYALDVSGDGNTIVGVGFVGETSQAYFFHPGEDLQFLGTMPGGDHTEADAVSADGRVIVGAGHTVGEEGSYWHLTRWTADGSIEVLGTLTGTDGHTRANAVTADGSIIVGEAFSPSSGYEGFRWTDEQGFESLGGFSPSGISDDGSVVVGLVDWPDLRAIIWDEAHGMRDLVFALEDQYGLDLTGWRLLSAYGVSGDGTVIVGHAADPMGHTRAFVATIPEPTTVVLLIVGGAVTLHRRPRRI